LLCIHPAGQVLEDRRGPFPIARKKQSFCNFPLLIKTMHITVEKLENMYKQ
jgi:hypothetical protein